jgi:N-acetylmuramoyl-L-alanine amidase
MFESMTRLRALVVALVLLGYGVARAGLPTVTHEGRPYVEAFRIAETLKAKLDADPDRAYLRMPGKVVTLTRNWARVEIDGKPVVLPAPVRVERGVWLVPEAFVDQVLPRLVATPPRRGAPSPPTEPAPAAKPARAPAAPAQTAKPAPTPAAPAPAAKLAPAPSAPGQTAKRAPAPAAPAQAANPVPAPTPPARARSSPAVPAPPPGIAMPPAPDPAEARAAEPKAPEPKLADAKRPDVKGLERLAAKSSEPRVPEPRAADKGPEAKLEDMRLRSYPTFTRVVLETSGPVRFRVESPGPREARVRILALSADAKAEPIRDGFVDEVRVERAGNDAIVRVSFEGTPGEIKTTTFADPHRFLLDLMRPADRGPRTTREVIPPLRTIVLDAGHGGHDTGAVGPGGLMEKDVAMDVTRRVASLLEERAPGTKVLLSRSGDYFVPLRDRTSFANRERADLFVSIHANAHREVASEGVEVYFLSSEATDSGARQVASLENGVVKLERANGRLNGAQNDLVKSILWDLAQSEFQQDSSRLAEVVLDSMTRSLRIPNRGVKQAGFYVLGGAAMPAVLVEIGFVSNPREERKLKEGKYRDEIARAIVAGLVEYKRAHEQRSRAAAR